MNTRTVVFTILTIVCLINAVFAAPQKVNFQGKLTNAAGNPVNGTVSMVFSIYDVASGGTALWTETQTVTVTNGIYNVLLGTNNPIDTELNETKPLWLGVQVGADAEMSPRAELTPGVYDLMMLNAISMKNGNVGIGTNDPQDMLHIHHPETSGDNRAGMNFTNAFTGTVRFEDGAYIGYGTASASDPGTFFIANRENTPMYFRTNNLNQMVIDQNGNITIWGTLYVTGGADLAEPFDVTDINALELGDVVVIDPQNPLHVTKSSKAYDKTVAGIVSSTTQAGYVAGSRSDGSFDKPVALVGRVLCNVSTENGAIEIGDLLTTSNTPGYAMKATDFPNAYGAIMGKALQAFDGDKGQIMVLVTLQ